jgi:hypothetical protein
MIAARSFDARICVLIAVRSNREVPLEPLTREVARIWRLNGIEIVVPANGTGECSGPVLRSLVLWIADSVERLPPGVRGAAPAMGGTLLENDVPVGAGYVLLDRVHGWLNKQLGQTHSELRLPATFGRLLGRIAAHELGHILLRSAVHTGRGLMRVGFDVTDLWRSSLERGAYELTAEQRASLQRELGAVARLTTARAASR